MDREATAAVRNKRGGSDPNNPWLELPESVLPKRIFWVYWPFIFGFHLLLPLMFLPYLFSWTGVALVFIGNYIFGSLGINLAYHRILTHGSLTVPKWLEHTFAIFGVCSMQDAPARWVAIHRMHHQHSDKRPDPHSPWVDFFWGHMGWLLIDNRELNNLWAYEKYARDVIQDRFYLKLERRHSWVWIYLAHAVLFFVGGMGVAWLVSPNASEAWRFGLSIFFWGVVVRTVYVWHITWFVNSLSHRFGYQNYETGEQSRNNWFVALLTNGEGWHNNHHADQKSAAHGHRWWEFDITNWTILALEKVGLAWDVKRPNTAKLNKRTLSAE